MHAGRSPILVTGGAGFIGSHTVGRLISLGHRVRVFDDLSTGRAGSVPVGAELVVGDVADPSAVSSAVAGCPVVIHLAALRAVPRSYDEPVEVDRVNRIGTATVLAAAAATGTRRVVLASSSSVYGDAAVRPTPEWLPPRPRSPYAASKVAAEAACREATAGSGGRVDTVALRYFNVYGPGQRPDDPYAAVVPRLGEALLTGAAPVIHGDGTQSRDFTFVTDAAAATVAAALAPRRFGAAAVNVAGGRPVAVLDVLAALAHGLGVEPAMLTHEPRRTGDVGHTHADLTAARRLLGWLPEVPFSEGIARTARAMVAAPAA